MSRTQELLKLMREMDFNKEADKLEEANETWKEMGIEEY